MFMWAGSSPNGEALSLISQLSCTSTIGTHASHIQRRRSIAKNDDRPAGEAGADTAEPTAGRGSGADGLTASRVMRV
jgi:hypothetical protein